jgi:cellulose synthase/poly-beta-1,6-N-acetylglucosamine synthase-like glycosyltransferase
MNSHNALPQAQAPECAALLRACGLSEADLNTLEREALRLGAHPLDLALGEGTICEKRALAELAPRIGARVSASPPAPEGRIHAEEAFALRGYALRDGTRVLAPNGTQIDLLLKRPRSGPGTGMILTTRQALMDALLAADGERLARKAAFDLPETYSARRWGPWLMRWRSMILRAGALMALALLGLIWLAPLHALILPPLVFSPLFLMAGLAVLTSTLESTRPPRAVPPRERNALPRYCIMVPLHREASIVPVLVKRLNALLYPRDRLDVLFLVEADDTETIEALRGLPLPPSMLVMPLPPGEPRTKPRAMNLALPFARGELLVAYDAEDAPEPDQLLRAAALFEALPARVACLQGRLAVANHRDGFLTRRFAVDYAALFDCIKAGMGRAAWPVPLGGTSNHFRTGLLHRVGGWDAWNVTEDADLGLRLARFGYLVEDLPSTTWEEAPNQLGAWMNQRTRWMKGWMQTLLVHLCTPRQAVAQLGLFRVAMIGSMGLSVILGALLYPLFLAGVIARLINPIPLGGAPGLLALADAMLVLAVIVAVLVELIPATIALFRRRALHLLLMVPGAPITHILVAIATWCALADLLRRPYFWHKTEHGLARTEQGLSALRNTRKTPRA